MFINLWQQIRSSYLGNIAVTVQYCLTLTFFSCDTIVIEVSIFIFIIGRLACHEAESWSVLKKHTHLEPPSKCLVTSWTWHVSLQYISNLKLLMHNKWVVMYMFPVVCTYCIYSLDEILMIMCVCMHVCCWCECVCAVTEEEKQVMGAQELELWKANKWEKLLKRQCDENVSCMQDRLKAHPS